MKYAVTSDQKIRLIDYIYLMEEPTMKPKTFLKVIVVLISLLILTGQSFAGNVSKDKVSKETLATIREAIQSQVKHPGYHTISDNLCCADVTFTITNEGRVIVKRIISDNEDLSDYVRGKLSQLKFDKIESPMNQHYRIKLSFRLI